MGSLRTLRRTATQQELQLIVYQLNWFKRQLLMGMADGVRLLHSPSGSSLGYDGAMHTFRNDGLIQDLVDLQLITPDHGYEYFLTSMGSTVSRFIQQRCPYQYLTHHIRPGGKFQGSKWVEDRSIVDTGKLVRQEIAECVRKGILPAGKYKCHTHKKRYKSGLNYRAIYVSLRLPEAHYDQNYLDDIDCTLRGILHQYTRERSSRPEIWVSADIFTG